ncbi:MAG: hypothetical protein KC917_19765 [Candidatus Omnitrophica bacterium]|nr:hypothetical protein [Candidatus Omnitrophota bacterium]
MARIGLPEDFKDLLKLLTSNKAEYLLVGGYAVTYHGYPRSTGDMDIWIPLQESNTRKVIQSLVEFGMSPENLSVDLFSQKDKIIRMGVPPLRIELLTGVSGVEFSDCYSRRVTVEEDGIPVCLISIEDLKKNKKASGRHKDLEDLERLP